MGRIGQAFVGMLLLFTGAVALAGPGFWTGNGPWGGVTYDMHVPAGAAGANTAYAATRGGLFRTVDGGLSWQRADVGVPGGLLGTPLAIDDLAPHRLLSLDSRGRVYRSSDGGENWVATGHMVPVAYLTTALADAPGDSLTVWMAILHPGGSPAEVLLHRSTDGGASFTPVAIGAGLPTGIGWHAVAVDPADADRILAGTWHREMGTTGVPAEPSLYRSTDGGASWAPVLSVPVEDLVPAVLDISFGAGSTVYAGTTQGLFRSDDDGANWNGPYDGYGQALLAHPIDALTVLVGSPGGMARSTDGGLSFVPVDTGLGLNPTYTSTLGSGVVSADVVGLAAQSTWPAPGAALWAATSAAGVFRSSDDAASWQAFNRGIGATNVRAVAVHPNPATAGQYLFAGFGDSFLGSPGLFLSVDAGTTWNTRNNQLRASQIRTIAIDPTTAGLTLGGFSSSHVYAGGGSVLMEGFFNAGLYKSVDGGASWSNIDAGLPTRDFGGQVATYLGTVRTLVLDPRSCVIPPAAMPCASGPLQRIYAAASGFTYVDVPTSTRHGSHRVIRSDDAGASWVALDGALPPSTTDLITGITIQVVPIPLLLGSSDPDVLYVGTITGRSGPPGTLFEDRASGVFRSGDGGTTWQQRSGGLPRRTGSSNTVVDVLAMAIHPLDDDVLWATAIDPDGVAATAPLYRTVDGGLNWTPSATGIPAGIDLRALLVDPGDPDILYASGYYVSGDDGSGSFSNPAGVFRSDDGGMTWLSISGGLQAREALAMTLDPFQPHILHLGTNTGVWSLEQVPDADGDGASDAAENFAPGGGDGDGDGAQDSTQKSVASTVIIFGAARTAMAKGGGGYVTSKVLPVEGACTQSVDVEAVLAARYGRDYLDNGQRYHTYPRDLLRFEVLDCQRAEVELTFHGADFQMQRGWSFRMFGPGTPGDDATVAWHDLSERAELVAPNRWRLTLDVDEKGSYRGEGDSILFMGGPACHDARIFQGTFETGYVPAPGCD